LYLGLAGQWGLRPAVASTRTSTSTICPFRIEVLKEQLAELCRRLAATRWSSRELVADRSQGVQLATIQALGCFWATEHDWRKTEAKLNALSQFTTEIDGVDIHFIRVRSPHKDALPLIMTHGWPGSVIELLEVVGPLTDPTAHGGRGEDAFDLVLPSLPGYGFSGEPTEVGWDVGRVARAWAQLMRRLGYTRYVAQGGDVGSAVTDAMGRQALEGLVGIHINLLLAGLASGGPLPAESEEERAALDALATFNTSGRGLPHRAGHAAADDRLRPARFTRRPGRLDARPRHRQLPQDLPRLPRRAAHGPSHPRPDRRQHHAVLLTGTGAPAARSYWENARATALAAGQAPPEVMLPVGFTTSPARSSRHHAPGCGRPTPTSPTSTRSTKAATSPPGKNPSSSPPRSAPRSDHSARGPPECRPPASLDEP
jgi:hypothetical protein